MTKPAQEVRAPSPSHARPGVKARVVSGPDSSEPRANLLVTGHFLLAAVVVVWLGSGVGTVVLAQTPGAYRWAIAAAWIGMSLLNLRHAVELAATVWPLVVYVAMVFLALPSSDPTGRAYLQNLAYVLVAYSIYSFYSAPGYHRYRKVIVALVLLDIAVVAVRTWTALDANPEISRFFASGNAYEDIVAETAGLWGVGGYPHAYALPAIMLVFLHRAITVRRHRIVSWAVVFLGTLLLVRMSFTIAVVLWVAFGLLLVAGDTIGRRHQSEAVLAGLLVIPLGVLLGPALLSAVARVPSVPDVVVIRLQELAALLSGEHSLDTDLWARLDQYATSLRWLGSNWLTGSTGSGVGMGTVGTHSSWLDSLGAFGLVSLLLFWFLFGAARRQLSHVAPTESFVLKIVWAYFAVLGVVNTLLFAHLILVWLVLVPFMLHTEDDPPAEGFAP